MIADYWEHAAFPFELVPRIAKLNLGGATIKGYGCPGQSVLGTAMAVIEIARVDASMSTFIMVHNSLAMLTIGRLLDQALKSCFRQGCWLRGNASNSESIGPLLALPTSGKHNGSIIACLKLVLVAYPRFYIDSMFLTIAGLLASEEQKRELLPDMASLKKIGAWGLTEPSNGSDASALQSSARKVGPSEGCRAYNNQGAVFTWCCRYYRKT